MKIKVKQKHINAARKIKRDERKGLGFYHVGEHCAIAQALKAKLGEDFEVGKKSIHLQDEGNLYCNVDPIRILLPKKAVSFIERFDEGKSVKPFEFDI